MRGRRAAEQRNTLIESVAEGSCNVGLGAATDACVDVLSGSLLHARATRPYTERPGHLQDLRMGDRSLAAPQLVPPRGAVRTHRAVSPNCSRRTSTGVWPAGADAPS